MQSKATSVAQYLAALPDDRRASVEAVRKVILANLDAKYEEGMQYGMIGYYVPLSVFPDGYHCDPRQGLPFAGLASQKGYMSLYLMSLYMSDDPAKEPPPLGWFRAAWARSGKKLDMGKSCIRFKHHDDLALDVIGELIRRTPAKAFVATYQAALASRDGARKPARPSGPAANRAAKIMAKSGAKRPRK